MQTILKKINLYELKDLKKDNDIFNLCYEKWAYDENNINPWADDNIESFNELAENINLSLNYSLSNSEYPSRSCYINYDTDFYDDLSNKEAKEIIKERLKDYKGIGFYLCEDQRKFALNLINNKFKNNYSIKDFADDLSAHVFNLWFKDNQHHFSKENFLNTIDANNYLFTESGDIY